MPGTPMQSIEMKVGGRVSRICLKLEGENPTGSMKFRTGEALIKHLEELGQIRAGSTLIESSSGNLAVALAFLCQTRGYHFIAVVDPKITPENRQRIVALGGQVEMVRQPDANGGYLLSRLAYVQALCRKHQNFVWTNQYVSPANPLIHQTTTAPEIYGQMQGKIDALFVPVSTGGTLAGIGRFFRQMRTTTKIIGVDAYGSVVFGTPAGPRRLTGIGSSQHSHFLTPDLFDMFYLVQDQEAFAFCRALSRRTGLLVGGSSGAVLAACKRYLTEHPEASRLACICADTGEHYRSTIFNDDWLVQQDLDLTFLEEEAQEMILPILEHKICLS